MKVIALLAVLAPVALAQTTIVAPGCANATGGSAAPTGGAPAPTGGAPGGAPGGSPSSNATLAGMPMPTPTIATGGAAQPVVGLSLMGVIAAGAAILL